MSGYPDITEDKLPKGSHGFTVEEVPEMNAIMLAEGPGEKITIAIDNFFQFLC